MKLKKYFLWALVMMCVLFPAAQHVQAASKLSTPAVTSVSNAANGMTVKWKKVTGSTGYYIYRKTNGSYQKIGTVKKGSTVTYTDKTAKSGTTYIYAVKAYKGKTVSNYGKSAKMKRLSQPSITFSNTSSGVKISWKKISGASKYRVYYKKSGKWVKLADTTSLSYVDKTVSSGSSRTYIVRAISGSCMSSYSSKTIKRLSQPSVKIANTASGVQISWIKISGAAGYHVYRKTTGSFTKIATVKSGISYTDKSAKSGTIYQYTVKAYFGSYSSSYKSVSIKRLSQPVSAASNTGSGVKISWKKISGASKYRVYRRTGSGNWTALGDTTDFYYTDKTAKSGTAYSYAVRAVNGSYISSYTSKSIIRLETPRPSLSNISSGVKISWNKIAGAKSYKVYRKSENGSYAAIGTSASTSFTDKSVTTRTKYTYCAKAVNGNDSSAYGEKTITYYYEENVVLDLVGILTPYYGVGIRCIV